jgi:hypothetical protein
MPTTGAAANISIDLAAIFFHAECAADIDIATEAADLTDHTAALADSATDFTELTADKAADSDDQAAARDDSYASLAAAADFAADLSVTVSPAAAL